jgi:tetratricopeptide (TPR) repeat protein
VGAGQDQPSLETLERLIALLINAQRTSEVDASLLEFYTETQRIYPPGIVRARAAFALGNWLYQSSRFDEAEPYLREALAGFREAKNPSKILSILCLDGLYQSLRRKTDPESIAEADAILAEVIDMAADMWGPDKRVGNIAFLASRLMDTGRYLDAMQRFVEAREIAADVPELSDLERDLERGVITCALFVLSDRQGEAGAFAAARDALELSTPEISSSARGLWTTATGAALYRSGELEECVTVLQDLAGAELVGLDSGERRTRLAGRAFLGMALAALGREEEARGQLSALRAALSSVDTSTRGRLEILLDELSSLVADGH